METVANRKSLSTRIIAFIASLALVLSFIPTMALPQIAFAETPTWYDSTQAEYTLTTADELSEFATLVNAGTDFSGKTVKLGGNIDLTGKSWTAIGTETAAFAGTFDGQSYTISNIALAAGQGYAGLFGVNAGTVKNFTITGDLGSYSVTTGLGIAVGYNKTGATVTRVINKASFSASNSYSPVGGIAGLNEGSIYQCGNEGNLSAQKHMGGIAGENHGSISECYNAGSITGTGHSKDNLGGIVGQAGGKNEGDPAIESSITYCYNTGLISNGGATGGRYFGGIAGAAYNGSGETITNCFCVNIDEGYSWQHNAIVGAVDSYEATIHNNYSLDTLVNGDTNETTMPNTIGIQKTEAEMVSAEFVTLINGTGSAFVADEGTWPILAWQPARTYDSTIALATEAEEVHEGDTFDVTVEVTYGGSIATAQADIEYNPSVATIKSISYADGIANGKTDDFNNETGKAKVSFYGDTLLNAKNGVAFATITFTAVAEGNASISVSNAVAGEQASVDDIVLVAPTEALVVPVGDAIVFTLYTADYQGKNVKQAKRYTMADLEKLASSGDAVAGLYTKGSSIGVWASSQYVTFEDLFADAGLTWSEGYSASWGGDSSQGKSANVFTYEELQNRYFLPNATMQDGAFNLNDEGKIEVPTSLALTAQRKFVSATEGDYATAGAAKEAALADTETEPNTLVTILGASEDQIKNNSAAGKPFWRDTDSILVMEPEPAVFSVYTSDSEGNNAKLAKSYTMSELQELVSSGDAVAGLYTKGESIGVWASSQYVTFDDLFADANVDWEEGYSISWGGDSSQGKSANVFTYEELQNRYFLPNATMQDGAFNLNDEGKIEVPASLALTAQRKFVSAAEGEYATAGAAKEAALADTETEPNTLVTILGASEDQIKNNSVAGKPFWRDTTSILVMQPETAKYSVSTDLYAGSYYKVTYTEDVAEGNVVSMNGAPMYLENGKYVALVTADEAKALKNASFTVAAGTAVAVSHNGDMNTNGKVNIVDAQIAYDVATNVYTDFSKVSMLQWLNGDVNVDGALDAVDAHAIQYYAHRDKFPATE